MDVKLYASARARLPGVYGLSRKCLYVVAPPNQQTTVDPEHGYGRSARAFKQLQRDVSARSSKAFEVLDYDDMKTGWGVKPFERASKDDDLYAGIRGCRTWQEFKMLLQETPDKFARDRNLSCEALVQLSELVVVSKLPVSERADVVKLVEQVILMMVSNLDRLRSESITKAVAAIAALDYPEPKAMKAIAMYIKEYPKRFQIQETMAMFAAFAKLGYKAPAVCLDAVFEQSMRGMRYLSPEAVTDASYAFSRLGRYPIKDDWVLKFMRNALPHLKMLSADGLAHCALLISRAPGAKKLLTKYFLDEFRSALLATNCSFVDAKSYPALLYAFTKLEIPLGSATLDSLAASLAASRGAMLAKLAGDELGVLAAAFTAAGYKAEQGFMKLYLACLQKRSTSMDGRAVVNIITFLAYATPTTSTTTAAANATVQPSADLLDELLAVLEGGLPSLVPKQLERLAASLHTLDHAPDNIWVDAFVSDVLGRAAASATATAAADVPAAADAGAAAAAPAVSSKAAKKAAAAPPLAAKPPVDITEVIALAAAMSALADVAPPPPPPKPVAAAAAKKKKAKAAETESAGGRMQRFAEMLAGHVKHLGGMTAAEAGELKQHLAALGIDAEALKLEVISAPETEWSSFLGELSVDGAVFDPFTLDEGTSSQEFGSSSYGQAAGGWEAGSSSGGGYGSYRGYSMQGRNKNAGLGTDWDNTLDSFAQPTKGRNRTAGSSMGVAAARNTQQPAGGQPGWQDPYAPGAATAWQDDGFGVDDWADDDWGNYMDGGPDGSGFGSSAGPSSSMASGRSSSSGTAAGSYQAGPPSRAAAAPAPDPRTSSWSRSSSSSSRGATAGRGYVQNNDEDEWEDLGMDDTSFADPDIDGYYDAGFRASSQAAPISRASNSQAAKPASAQQAIQADNIAKSAIPPPPTDDVALPDEDLPLITSTRSRSTRDRPSPPPTHPDDDDMPLIESTRSRSRRRL